MDKATAMPVLQATSAPAGAVYPPRVVPPKRPPNVLTLLFRVVRNPLKALPEAVYHEPFVRNDTVVRSVVWVTAPPLVDQILQGTRDAFPKSYLDFELLRPLLGKGLLTSEGDDWRWQRSIVAPLFRHKELLRYVPHMTAAADTHLQRWRADPNGSVQQIDDDMTSATFQVIARTMLPGGGTELCPSIAKEADNFLRPISWPVAYGLLGLPIWGPFPGRATMRRAIKNLRGCVGKIISQRRTELMPASSAASHSNGADAEPNRQSASPAGEADLLLRAMQARHPETGASMTDEQILDTLLTFLLAGHETTAKALTWSLYLLARAPNWQQRLLEEIRAVAADRPITGAHIDSLPIVTMVLKEAMRLYPPVPVLTRLASKDISLGNLTLKAGTLVVIPIYAVHRHRKLWNDPDRFDPTRFDPHNGLEFERTQFMPFGAGPRICVGASFAMIEATAILATLVRGARFEITDTSEPPEPIARVTLRPNGGMPLRVTMRE